MRIAIVLFLAVALSLLGPAQVYPDQHHYAQKRNIIEASRQAAPERVLIMEATAYCYTGQRTKTGTWPQRGTVAVDPWVIPLGSWLWVEGYGAGVAEDTGSAIRGNRIDVFMETEAEALNWGRRWVRVRIYDGN